MRKISLVLCLCAIAASPVLAERVTIKVVDPLGKPVQGVQVMVCQALKGCPAPQSRTPKTNRLGIYTTDIKARAVGYVNSPGYVEMSRVLVKGVNLFTLEPATQVTGTVVDTQGKPVAGASIQLIRATRPDGSMVSYSCSPFSREFVFKTAADGRYVVPGVPAEGEVWLMLEDPRFAEGSVNAQLGAKAPPAPPIVARPAAQIAGKVVYENGKPAVGVLVEVFVSGSGNAIAATKAGGSYVLQSLSAGQATVTAMDRSGKWVSSSVGDLTTVEGKTIDAPNIVLSAGAIIEGTVTDEATGKPRPGIEIMVGGPQGSWMTAGGARTASDKNGHYRVRVGPGKNRIQLFNSDGFGRPEPQIGVEVKNGEKKTVPIKVQRQVVLSGKLVDTNGKPLGDQRMSVMVMADEEHNRQMGGRACTDKAGKFRVTDLVSGKVRLTIGDEFGVQAWEVVEPKDLKLPAPGPVTFVLRKVVIGKLEGRAVTPAGKPVSGATVTVWVIAAEPETWLKTPSLSTDAEGVYRIDGFKPGMKVTFKSAKRPGYAYRSGGVFTAKDKKASISDIVLAPLTGKLAGRVTDSTGAPVTNARVATLEAGADGSALTGADGRFLLSSIPEGDVTLIAGTGSSYGSMKAGAGGAPVEIKLEDSPKVDAGQVYAALQACWDEASKKPKDNWWRTRIPVLVMQTNPDLALKMIYRADGSLDEEPALETISALVRSEPGRALKWGLPLLGTMKNPRNALRAACILGVAAAGLDTRLAGSLYARAKDNIGKAAKASSATQEAFETLIDYAHLAALAGKLANGEGDAMLEKLSEAVKQNKDHVSDALSFRTNVIAMGSVPLAEKLAGQMTESATSAMAGIAVEASYYDVTSARRVLEQIEKAGGNEINHMAYGEAALYVILALGKNDPVAALEVARSVHNDRYRKLALGIAAPFQPQDAQIGVLREAFDAVRADYSYVAEDMSWIAWMARSVDPNAGDKMFASAKAQLLADPEQRSSELTAYAMHYAAADPAQSRLMLETAFAQCKQPGQSRGTWALQEAAVAMSVVDVGRAMELAKQIPDLTDRGYAMTKIARYALSSDDQRQKLMRLHWTRSECWYYGGPSPW